jgi:hypothetical protein
MTNATAMPLVRRLGASLKFLIAALPLVQAGFKFGHTFGASAWSLAGSWLDGFFPPRLRPRQGGEWTRPLAFICRSWLKTTPLRWAYRRIDILAHIMLVLIWTAFDDAFVRIRKTLFVL